MKILFTADLHSSLEAFRQFVRVLDTDDYDCGIIAGDLMDDGVTTEDMVRLLHLDDDDLLPELAPAEETYEETLNRQVKELNKPTSNFMKSLSIRERELKEILTVTKKPIFVIKGNHDKTLWKSHGNIRNLHGKKVRFKGYFLIGYQYTEFERTEAEQQRDFQALKRHVNERTILVTHIPAKGTLDNSKESYSYGSIALSELVKEKKPRLHLHGHVHGRFGWEGHSVNGAYPKERAFLSIDVDANKITIVDDLYSERYYMRQESTTSLGGRI